jgi:hypothetical protein
MSPSQSSPVGTITGGHLRALLALFVAVAAGCNGESAATDDAETDGAAEAPLTATHLTVNLQTWSGNYLVADQGGGADLMAYSTWAKGWETFTLTDLDGGSLLSGDLVTLKASGGQWASAIHGGGGKVTFTAPWEKAWEKFRIVKVGGSGKIGSGDKIALQTTVTGQFVSALDAGGGKVTATAPVAREWETLTLLVAGGGSPSGSPGGTTSSGTDYAPYFPTWTWGDGSTYPYKGLVDLRNKTGITGVTLAFVLAGNGCHTDGDVLSHVGDIKAFVAMGGHVKASFGGAEGTYLEHACGDPDSLAGAIEAFVDASGITDLDFDIEQDGAYGLSDRRGKALKKVQDSRGIKVAFTLPTDPTGLAGGGLQVVQGALDAGVHISHVNLMTMDYGQFQGQPLGPVAIQSVNAAKGQLEGLIPGLTDAAAYAMLGATPMIGRNDSGEMFSLDDAKQLAQFARDKKLGLIAFWSIDRDRVCSSGKDECSTVNAHTFDFHNALKTVQP